MKKQYAEIPSKLVKEYIASLAKKEVFGSMLLVVGSCLGAGMLALPIMSAFITRYHERAEDNNYYKVVQINYMSDKLELT